jgi:hypothetical protein
VVPRTAGDGAEETSNNRAGSMQPLARLQPWAIGLWRQGAGFALAEPSGTRKRVVGRRRAGEILRFGDRRCRSSCAPILFGKEIIGQIEVIAAEPAVQPA